MKAQLLRGYVVYYFAPILNKRFVVSKNGTFKKAYQQKLVKDVICDSPQEAQLLVGVAKSKEVVQDRKLRGGHFYVGKYFYKTDESGRRWVLKAVPTKTYLHDVVEFFDTS